MPSPKPELTKLTELWRSRLRDAKLKVDFARGYKKEVEQDFPSGTISTPDGNFEHYQALRAENLALAEYHRVLRIYEQLVLRGEVPGEEDRASGETAV